MALTLTVKDHWTDGKKIHVIGQIAASGNYTTGGDTLSFNLPAVKSSKVPELVRISGSSDLAYKYAPGATRDVGKVKMLGTSGVQATGTLTSDATNVSNNETVTLSSVTYTFKTVLTGAANEVFIGASASATLDNLKAAVNGAAGAGTTYGTGTVANPDVIAGAKTPTTIVFSARVSGTAGNSLATTETSAHLSFGAATLGGGTDNDGTGAELAAGAYTAGVTQDVILVEAIFPQLR